MAESPFPNFSKSFEQMTSERSGMSSFSCSPNDASCWEIRELLTSSFSDCAWSPKSDESLLFKIGATNGMLFSDDSRSSLKNLFLSPVCDSCCCINQPVHCTVIGTI